MVSGINFKHPEKMQVIEFSLYINTLIASFFKLFISFYTELPKALFIINFISELIIIISASFLFFFKYKMGKKFILIVFLIGVIDSIANIVIVFMVFGYKVVHSNFAGPYFIILIFGGISSFGFYFVSFR